MPFRGYPRGLYGLFHSLTTRSITTGTARRRVREEGGFVGRARSADLPRARPETGITLPAGPGQDDAGLRQEPQAADAWTPASSLDSQLLHRVLAVAFISSFNSSAIPCQFRSRQRYHPLFHLPTAAEHLDRPTSAARPVASRHSPHAPGFVRTRRCGTRTDGQACSALPRCSRSPPTNIPSRCQAPRSVSVLLSPIFASSIFCNPQHRESHVVIFGQFGVWVHCRLLPTADLAVPCATLKAHSTTGPFNSRRHRPHP